MRKKFFEFVWQVNALVIFTVGVAGLLVLLIAAFGIGRDAFRSRRHARPVVTADGTSVDQTFRLGDFDAVVGTPHLMANLFLNRDRKGIYSSSGSSYSYDAANYLFYDTGTRKSHWLLDHSDSLFLQTTRVTRGRSDDDSQRVIGFLFYVLRADTNGDGTVNAEDSGDIAVAAPSGDKFLPLISNVDELLGSHKADEDTETVMYRTGRTVFAAEIDIVAGEVLSSTRVDELGPEITLSD